MSAKSVRRGKRPTSMVGGVALLHCVSGYPAPAEEYHLATIPDIVNVLASRWNLSDHTLGSATASTTALGAAAAGKHFTLSRADGGPDSAFSMEPAELSQLVMDTRTAWSALGAPRYSLSASEQSNIQFRRSLYLVKDVAAGERLTAAHVRSVRPGWVYHQLITTG